MQIELSVSKWVNDGFCIGYHNGKTVFVSGALPNEKVVCEIYEETTKYIKARTINVLQKSENRRIPPCSIYQECGGCSFQHIDYSEERQIKINLLYDGLNYNGLLKNLNIQKDDLKIYFRNEYGYRNNVQLKLKHGVIGFFKPKTNEIVSLPKSGCLLLASDLNEYILKNSNLIPEDGKLRYDSNTIKNYKKEISKFSVQNKEILIPEDGFFQINQFLLEEWIKKIVSLSGLNENILELFCGAGTLSIFLAEKHKKLTGIEVSAKSIEYCKKNSVVHNLKNTSFEKRDLYQNDMPKNKEKNFICVANPPRAGLGKLVKKYLLDSNPKKIIYSSCNYTTLLPDLKDLSANFEVKMIEIFDFFPRTPYFESLVLLESRK